MTHQLKLTCGFSHSTGRLQLLLNTFNMCLSFSSLFKRTYFFQKSKFIFGIKTFLQPKLQPTVELDLSFSSIADGMHWNSAGH